jgi:hypothetical protein
MRSIVRKYYELICCDDIIYNKLKEKYPELENYLYEIKKNVISDKKENILNYLEIKLNLKKDNEYIENLFLDERLKEIRKRIDQNWEIADKEETKNETTSFEILDSNKVYKIKKGEKYWSEFKQNIASKIFFQNFSILEKKNHLEVYFI